MKTQNKFLINLSKTNTQLQGNEYRNLFVRGLQDLKISKDLEAKYRKARDLFNLYIENGIPRNKEILKTGGSTDFLPYKTKCRDFIPVCEELIELANNGFGKAYYPVALLYEKGWVGGNKDFEKYSFFVKKSMEWSATQRPNDTDIEFFCDIADVFFLMGNEKKYNEFRKKAAEAGSLLVQIEDFYTPEITLDRNKSIEYPAAVKDSYADVFVSGLSLEYEEAFFWYRMAAEEGHWASQRMLGWMYQDGKGVEQDYEKAIYWYEKAAQQSGIISSSDDLLDLLYFKVKDYPKSFYWYSLLAQLGDVFAQRLLGWMYEDGRGVEQDYEQAVYWYRLAADQGDATAQWLLGRMYEDGKGVEQDIVTAVSLYRNAAINGCKAAKDRLSKLDYQEN